MLHILPAMLISGNGYKSLREKVHTFLQNMYVLKK